MNKDCLAKSLLAAKLKQNKAFTLTEILVVVAIVAVLACVSIPMVGDNMEKAREATDSANERGAWGIAVAEYLLDGTFIGQQIAPLVVEQQPTPQSNEQQVTPLSVDKQPTPQSIGEQTPPPARRLIFQ